LLATLAIVLVVAASLVWSTFQPGVIMDEWVGIVQDKYLGRIIEGEYTYLLTTTRADEKRVDTQVPASTARAKWEACGRVLRAMFYGIVMLRSPKSGLGLEVFRVYSLDGACSVVFIVFAHYR
jgi:hypothetical protein